MFTVHIKKRLAHFMVNVQFSIKKEIAVLFGPSGSGKTTILNCIAGLSKMNDGYITLNDRTLNENGKVLIPVQERKIGYVFQDYALFPHKTVWENITYGMKQEKFTRDLVDELNITHLLNQYPHEISGGEKQRTALIRALATEPEILLLDEPFSALDAKAKQTSYEQLLRIQKRWKIPIILVTHNLEEVNLLADKVFYIENGVLVQN